MRKKENLVKTELKAFSMAAQADLLNYLEDKSYNNEAECDPPFLDC